MHARKDTITLTDLYCCGLISHILSECSTTTSPFSPCCTLSRK